MPSLGGAIACVDNASPRIENVEIFGSMANLGAGIAVNDSDPIITGVTIDGTEARNRGGGIYLSNSNAEITAVTIKNSTAYDFGGGIYMTNSSPIIKYVDISNNTATKGGGMFIDFSNPTLKYNTVHSNSAEYRGGGIYCGSSSQVSLINMTLWNNSAEDGGGIYFHNSRGQVLNSILWENTPSQAKIRTTSSLNFIKVAYTNITDGEDGFETSSNGAVYFYDGITSDDPRFSNALGGDLSLSGASSLIDAGVTNYNFGEPNIASPVVTEYVGNSPDIGGIETGYELLSVEETVNNLPSSFDLGKAYPNPFNPVTQFNYTLSEYSNISINVYNLNGELVDQLYDGQNAMGEYSVKWEAGNLPSGFYLISVIANGFEQVNKVLLMK
jgi:predicted outer membrane repeat protein